MSRNASQNGNHVNGNIMSRTQGNKSKTLFRFAMCSFIFYFLSTLAVANVHAQGPILALSPGGKIQVVAGNGQTGFSGDNGSAESATLEFPVALAADSAGNVYFADRDNHRIRKMDTSGTITTVAGSGLQGFWGDNGPATKAGLDSPSGIAVDAAGNIFIADTRNNRIRVVSGSTITTIAGNGAPGFSGDGAAALAASLRFPRGIALDASGAVYVADTGNHVVRKISAGIITTVAGNGLEGFSGDLGPATSANLASPVGLAVDAAGNLYIADTGNRRVRFVSGGVITTLAGNGVQAYSGDGGSAASASLARPVGLSLDASGTLFITDAGNNVLRRVRSGFIRTAAGDTTQGFFGDSGPPMAAALNNPTGVVALSGTVYISDKDNQRIRRMDITRLTFSPQIVGTSSSPLAVTVGNQGSSTLTVDSLIGTSSDFSIAPGGSCALTFPQNIAPGSSCTINIVFRPSTIPAQTGMFDLTDNAPGSPHLININGSGLQNPTTLALRSMQPAPTFGAAISVSAKIAPVADTTIAPPTGTVVFSEGQKNLATQTVVNGTANFAPQDLSAGSHNISAVYDGDALYSGSSNNFVLTINKAAPTVHLASSATQSAFGNSLSFTATIASPGATATGSVTFHDGSATLGTAALDSTGAAVYSSDSLPAGAHTITASYAGDNDFSAAVSPSLAQNISDFTLAATPANSAVTSGGRTTFVVTSGSIGGFSGPVSLQCQGLPATATCTFSPSQLTLSSGANSTSTLTVTTTRASASFRPLAPTPQSPTAFRFVMLHDAAARIAATAAASVLALITALIAVAFLLAAPHRRKQRLGWAISAVAFAAGGCASTVPSPVSNQPQTFQITISAMSTTPGTHALHTTQLHLTVNP
ncbi:MAG TPA: Ig-like domain repeat protein [Candidatus Acidoferrum sp.]|jgi:sugar lactone lactonase YvrE